MLHLFDVFVGFQLNPIGIIADIEKAYLQITVVDCHHILSLLQLDDMFKDILEKIIFRFPSVIFETNC